MNSTRPVRRWPLMLIAAPAAVSIWSGWVGLGSLCGFGPVTPLPGILNHFQINTAITLPVGVEAYGAFALGAWLTPGTPEQARTFARRSAIGALVLGMTGQVVYHLLAAAHATRAPWPVVVLVSCLPVVTLGFGAGLAHLLGNSGGENTPPRGENSPANSPPAEAVPTAVPAPAPAVPAAVPGPYAALNGHREAAAEMFADDLAAGRLPGIRAIRDGLHVGQPKASQVQAYLRTIVRTP